MTAPAVLHGWMGLALDAAAGAAGSVDVPVGAVVVDEAGTVLAWPEKLGW